MLHSYLSSFEINNNHFGLLKQQAAIGLTLHEDIRFSLLNTNHFIQCVHHC